MFEVGDKVRYVPNEDSPRNASTDGKYIAVEHAIGFITRSGKETWLSYPYQASFDEGLTILAFSEAELVKVA